jgi:hypothetical protein
MISTFPHFLKNLQKLLTAGVGEISVSRLSATWLSARTRTMFVNTLRRAVRPTLVRRLVADPQKFRCLLRAERLEDRTAPSASLVGTSDLFGDILSDDFGDPLDQPLALRRRHDDLTLAPSQLNLSNGGGSPQPAPTISVATSTTQSTATAVSTPLALDGSTVNASVALPMQPLLSAKMAATPATAQAGRHRVPT